MPAPRLKITGTSFAGMTAAYRTPICVKLYFVKEDNLVPSEGLHAILKDFNF
jgi:hypothetical protein